MTGHRPRILVISFSPLLQDARVLRQIAALASIGEVVTLGYGPAPAQVQEHLEIGADISSWHKNRTLLATRRYRRAYWTTPVVQAASALTRDRYPDVVVANDADSLPLALSFGVPVHADLHEYAPRQNEDNRRWRLFVAPYYRWLLRRHLPLAASSTTVGPRLAQEYAQEFGVRPGVVLNAPHHRDQEPAPVGTPLRLVHSGVAMRNRRLEWMIEAVGSTSRQATLDLYLLPNDAPYLDELRALAADMPEVTVHDPVPPGDLPRVLQRYDVGVFVLPPVTFNYRFALPNKFFDYVQGRLAVLVGPSEEMAGLIRAHGIGVVASDFSARALAAALDSLDDEDVARYKSASHAMAAQWSAEEQTTIWTSAVQALLPR